MRFALIKCLALRKFWVKFEYEGRNQESDGYMKKEGEPYEVKCRKRVKDGHKSENGNRKPILLTGSLLDGLGRLLGVILVDSITYKAQNWVVN